MKVCNIIEDGRLAGPQIRIADVARFLLKKDIDTTVVFPKYESDLFKKKLDEFSIKNKPCRLHHLTKDKKHLLKYTLFFIYELIALYRFFKKEDFDIIHCSGGAWQCKGVIAGKLAGAKTLWHLNDTQMPALLRLLFRPLAYIFADGFIVAGHRVKQYYLNVFKRHQKPIFEIQAPVNTEVFNPSEVKSDPSIERRPGIKIVTICNLNSTKGLEYFIQMAAILSNTHENLFFFIVGPAYASQKKYVDKLNRLKNHLNLNNLIFRGPSHNVASVLRAADIYVCSSIAEASPLAVWEAMSMEKAIVSSAVGDVPRFLKDNKNGFIVPIKDPRALVDKVGILIRDPDLRKNFGKKARQTAKRFLDIKIMVKKHVEAYHQIVG